jgi:hypothetical protein
MANATELLALTCLLLQISAASAQGPTAIRGRLRERGEPIADATVYLQSFDNERCAKLFTSHKIDRKSQLKFERCTHDVSTAAPDSRGYYEFTGLKAGWYAVHFLWNINAKPTPSKSMFKEGSWGVMYAGHKDSTGNYDTMAQDPPFYHSGKEAAVRDFDTQQ